MEIRGNTKYVAIGIIVDDTKEVTVDDNTLGYITTGVKILDLESLCVGNIDTDEFMQLHIANRIWHNLDYITDNYNVDVALDKCFNAFYKADGSSRLERTYMNPYVEYVFNKSDVRVSNSDKDYIAILDARDGGISFYFLYYYSTGDLKIVLYNVISSKRNANCIDVDSGEYWGWLEPRATPQIIPKQSLIYYKDLRQFRRVGLGVYKLTEATEQVIVPNDCKYFIIDSKEDVKMQSYIIRSIVLPVCCKGILFNCYRDSFENCKIYISKNNQIMELVRFRDKMNTFGIGIEYY